MKILAAVLVLLACSLAQAEEPRDRAEVLKLGAKVVESGRDGVYTVEWFPEEMDKKKDGTVRVIFALHGSQGHAETSVRLWQPFAKKRGVAVVALQWWLGEDKYLQPKESYALLEARLAALRKDHPAIAEKGHLLDGFSRGSANVPGLAILDRDPKKGLFSLFLCDSGAWPEDKPPPYVRDAGDDAFKGQRFVGYFGGKDEQFGAPATKAGRAAKAFIEKRGGKFELWYEPEDGTHGTFMNTPKMVEEALDVWLK